MAQIEISPECSSLSFHGGGEEIIRIDADYTIKVNPKFSNDEAAKAFWEAVERLRPTVKES